MMDGWKHSAACSQSAPALLWCVDVQVQQKDLPIKKCVVSCIIRNDIGILCSDNIVLGMT